MPSRAGGQTAVIHGGRRCRPVRSGRSRSRGAIWSAIRVATSSRFAVMGPEYEPIAIDAKSVASAEAAAAQ